MNAALHWQNLVLSAVLLVAIGLLAYSIKQLFKLKALQPENKSIFWLVVFSFVLILISCFFLYLAVFNPSSLTEAVGVVTCFVAALFVWFATRAGNTIAKDLQKSAALEHYYATHDDLTGLPNLTFF